MNLRCSLQCVPTLHGTISLAVPLISEHRTCDLCSAPAVIPGKIDASCLKHLREDLRVQYAINAAVFLHKQGFPFLKKHEVFITENQSFWYLLLSLLNM